MSSLKDLCGPLPVDPLPPALGRDHTIQHAPTLTPNLSPDEERVSSLYNKRLD